MLRQPVEQQASSSGQLQSPKLQSGLHSCSPEHVLKVQEIISPGLVHSQLEFVHSPKMQSSLHCAIPVQLPYFVHGTSFPGKVHSADGLSQQFISLSELLSSLEALSLSEPLSLLRSGDEPWHPTESRKKYQEISHVVSFQTRIEHIMFTAWNSIDLNQKKLLKNKTLLWKFYQGLDPATTILSMLSDYVPQGNETAIRVFVTGKICR